MNLDKDKLIETLKYWDSKQFRELQKKLTSAAKIIRSEVLSKNVKSFLSSEEIEVLNQAAQILGGIKYKVELAKESKARDENETKRLLETHKRMKQEIIQTLLPLEVRPENYVEILRFRLTIPSMFNSNVYYECFDTVKKELNRALNPDNRITVRSVVDDWRREIHDTIRDVCWKHKEEPTAEKLENFIALYDEKKLKLKSNESAFIQVLSGEVDRMRHEADVGARRANFKTV